MDIQELEVIKLQLSHTPRIIRSIVQNLPESLQTINEGENTWSVFDIIGHLIHGDETDWIPRSKIILGNEEDKTFPDFDRFAMFEKNQGKTINHLLDAFDKIRIAMLLELELLELDNEKLAKQGIHPNLGQVNLSQLLSTWLVHDYSHLVQIIRVLAMGYQKAVGPWSAYLSILQNHQ